MTLTELVNKTLAPGNEIEKAIGRGAVQEAVQRINAISDVLNEQNATNDNMVEQNKRVRSEKQMSHLGEAVLRDTVIEFGLKHTSPLLSLHATRKIPILLDSTPMSLFTTILQNAK